MDVRVMWDLSSLSEGSSDFSGSVESPESKRQEPKPEFFPDNSSSSNNEVKCRVCELTASGNNFGVTTCESCKTFFRRNAKRDPEKIRCLHAGKCNVVKEYSRSCTACRLDKCFAVGMKKELILSEEKLKNRAKPTFKKPRYRWCRIPAHIDVDQLLAMLPTEQQQQQQQQQQELQLAKEAPISIKQEYMPVPDTGFQINLDRQQLQPQQRQQQQQQQRYDNTSVIGAGTIQRQRIQQPASSLNSTTMFESSGSFAFECSQIYNQFNMCITNFLMPFEESYAMRLTSRLYSIEEGFTALESSIRKMILFIPEMPHFDELDKSLLGKLIKRRVFGSIHIISLFNYNYQLDSWLLLLQNSHGLEEIVRNVREAIFGCFSCLTNHRLPDGRQLYSQNDVELLYKTLIHYYYEMQQLFGDASKMAAVILMGIYLLQDDAGAQLFESEQRQIRRVQEKFAGYLRELINSQQQQQQQQQAGGSDQVYSQALLQLGAIRWLESRYQDAAKLLQLQRLPPLMQELISAA